MVQPTFGNSELSFTDINELEGGAHALHLKQLGGGRKRRRKTRRRTKRKSKRRTRRLKGKRTKDCVCIKCLCKKCKCKPKRKSRRTKLRKQLKGGETPEEASCGSAEKPIEACKQCHRRRVRELGQVGHELRRKDGEVEEAMAKVARQSAFHAILVRAVRAATDAGRCSDASVAEAMKGLEHIS